ncbi:ATP-binding protein [Methylomonas sp. OY6]|uniref:ATP-binding protein n=1 Tax=Methylomonas defluvii TaxID=3045149 RepID=A0ABU4UD74_9GAMM|nr:ATP-binding protein [Methylomonas sp. OY6]MDX8127429.1 ATP-binding protein [Methylomonas sp. OY6]
MADFLIQHLKNKAHEHSALEMLVNQWGFDEKLIPKALQTIGNLFPHYSRHDVSHSKQILINIERLLGPVNIGKLTATDTWLLLEAAYWHDIGMVVPQQDIEDALGNTSFRQYIEQIRNNPNHELNRFSQSFDSKDISQCFGGADNPMDAVDKFRQLMAEWFRQQHADRANKIVQAPWESVGISSPRTELIPARLFKLLGRICHMHGLPFKQLLSSTGLPFREAGLAQEDCHPRFIACLLRMGDLLDLDDNRFCPVMQHIAGENRPSISKAHEDKHAGLRHLRVDQERIEITAECETIDGYLETFKWFDWLKQEIQDQMAHWQDIVPRREFGLLPTLGEIAVRLSGNEQILNEGQRPQFGIDAKQAIKLLQGNNLYSTKFACIRELLQNAVDATLLRLWLTHQEERNSDIWKNPISEDVKKILKTGKVEVKFEELTSDANTPDDKSCWKLEIKDNGTGISRDDLGYMLKIGGSQSNTTRQLKINSMPEWMKPSGAFGIGFQSVFLITDVIKLTTKSIFTNEILEVTMHSPTKDKEGLVVLKLLENNISRPYGTSIEIFLLFNKFANSYSMPFGESLVRNFIDLYDPILDKALPLNAAELADKINTFSENSLLPITGKLKPIDKPEFAIGSENFPTEELIDNWRFIDVNEHQVSLKYQPNLGFRQNEAFYRGQPFKQNSLYLPNVAVAINLMSGKAGEWLMANRDQLMKEAEQDFSQLALLALEKLVQDDLETPTLFPDSNAQHKKAVFSLFLESMSYVYGGNWTNLAKKVDGAWLELNTNNITFQELFERESWILGIKGHDDRFPITGCDLVINNDASGSYIKGIIIKEWYKTTGKTVQVIENESNQKDDFNLRYQFAKKPQPLYSNKALAIQLAHRMHLSDSNRRFILGFQDKFEKLYLSESTKLRAGYLFEIYQPTARFVLLPFLFSGTSRRRPSPKVSATPSELDALCKWLQPNLEKLASIEEIRKEYENLIAYIDDEIMTPSLYWEDWKIARGI